MRPGTKRALAAVFWLMLVAAIIGGLIALSVPPYFTVFHSIVELFSIAVAVAIFLIAWNVRQRMANDFLLFIALSYAAVCALDLVHTLAYEGMNVIPGITVNEPTQLWIAARYLQAMCLMIAPVWLTRRLPFIPTMVILGLIDIIVLLTIFRPWPWLPAFPDCHLGKDLGLTSFKIASEYLISAIMLIAVGFLWLRRSRLDKAVFVYMVVAIVLTMASEIAFTSYVSVQARSNMIGHLLKGAAVYMTYKALIQAGLRRPFDVLFRGVADNERQFKSILDALPVAVFLSDEAGKVVFTNPAAGSIWGMSTHVTRDRYGEYKGRWLETGLPVQPEQWALARTLDTRQPYTNDLVEIDGPGNTTKIIHNFSIPIVGDGGKFIGAVVVTDDVTDRIRALEQVRMAKDSAERTAAELARSNEDLEQFAYVSSHDLQEPLRMVAGFMQLLEQNYRGKLDPTADKYIHYAVDGARRMQQLIQDLLAYSRVSTKGHELVPESSRKALDRAMANLRGRIEESKAQVTIGDLPEVRGDAVQLTQLFQNLLGNAMKFCGDKPPMIHVDACQDGEKWLFTVRDNGIGIAPEYGEKVFVIFQRLHTKEKYPGTGIGLAICKKIVERHGGRIWVESTPGEGSTFYFTLPA